MQVGATLALHLSGKTIHVNHDADEETVKAALESLSNINTVSVKFQDGKATACMPHDGLGAGDFIVTFQSLVDRAGDVPLMTAQAHNLQGTRRIDIETVNDGDAPLGGSFRLRFRGPTTKAIDASLSLDDIAASIQSELEALDTIESQGVKVRKIDLANGGEEMIFSVEFQGDGVGGDVVVLEVVSEHSKIYGTEANIYIKTDGEAYVARNGMDAFHSRPGNILSGACRLKLRGHVTDEIPFNGGSDLVKSRLEALPNIEKVDVQVSEGTKELGYTWSITFLSSPGYFPPPSRNVDTLEYESDLGTSVDGDESATIHIEVIREGDDSLSGQFTVAYYDGTTEQTAPLLRSFISSYGLQNELESLSNVGRVAVTRTKLFNGYSWEIELVGCSHKGGVDVCNEGDLVPLVVKDVSLQGCGAQGYM